MQSGLQYLHTFAFVATNECDFLQYLAIEVKAEKVGLGTITNLSAFAANAFFWVSRQNLSEEMPRSGVRSPTEIVRMSVKFSLAVSARAV